MVEIFDRKLEQPGAIKYGPAKIDETTSILELCVSYNMHAIAFKNRDILGPLLINEALSELNIIPRGKNTISTSVENLYDPLEWLRI